jgi:predicted metal-binding protein
VELLPDPAGNALPLPCTHYAGMRIMTRQAKSAAEERYSRSQVALLMLVHFSTCLFLDDEEPNCWYGNPQTAPL